MEIPFFHKEQPKSGKPIRIHHLLDVGNLLRGRKGWFNTTDNFPWGLELEARTEIATIVSSSRSAILVNLLAKPIRMANDVADYSDVEYAFDILGNTSASQQTYYEATCRFYRDFLIGMTSPQVSYPLITQPDQICGTCIVGRHCTEKMPRMFNKDLILRTELVKYSKSVHYLSGNRITAEGLCDINFYHFIQDVKRRLF